MVKRAVITGASSGIGEQFAYQLADQGYTCLLIARREDRLKQVTEKICERGGSADYRVADLTDPSQVEEVASHLAARPVDLLVNNAGYGGFGFLTDLNLQAEMDMLQLNITTLVRLTRAVIPQMVERKSGGVIQVASVVAFQPSPYMATYGASKSFVLHYSEAIQTELKGTGVHVMALCPGGTATEFAGRAQVGEQIQSMFTMQPELVVSQAIHAFNKRKRVIVPGPMNKVITHLYRFLPRQWISEAAGRILSPRKR
jgi:short-subunit dehydrogenase